MDIMQPMQLLQSSPLYMAISNMVMYLKAPNYLQSLNLSPEKVQPTINYLQGLAKNLPSAKPEDIQNYISSTKQVADYFIQLNPNSPLAKIMTSCNQLLSQQSTQSLLPQSTPTTTPKPAAKPVAKPAAKPASTNPVTQAVKNKAQSIADSTKDFLGKFTAKKSAPAQPKAQPTSR